MTRLALLASTGLIVLTGCGGSGVPVGPSHEQLRLLGQNAVRSIRAPLGFLEILPTTGAPMHGDSCLPGMPNPMQPGSLNHLLDLAVGQLERVDLFHDENQTIPAGFLTFLRQEAQNVQVPAFQMSVDLGTGDQQLFGQLQLLGVPGTGDYEVNGTLVHANRGQIAVALTSVQGHPNGTITYTDPSGFTATSTLAASPEGLNVGVTTSLGVGGQFFIGHDCSGSGTLMQGSLELATLNWNRQGAGTITFRDGTSLPVNFNSFP
jgi:hypothetical protein